MILQVTEKCMHEDSDDQYTGIRTYLYEVEDANTLEEALEICNKNFNTDNIIESDDDFENTCLDSYTQSVSIYEL